MKYVIIGVAVIIVLVILAYIAQANSIKKAPERLVNARKKFAAGETNEALWELDRAYAIPTNQMIAQQYGAHLLGVLSLLKEIFADMNISGDKLIDPLYNKLSSASAFIKLQENDYKPLEDFFKETDSDEKLVAFLQKTALTGGIAVVESEENYTNNVPELSSRTTEFINRGGKFLIKGDADNAIAVYKEALAQSWDKHDEAFLNDQMGSCYLMKKDLVNAEAQYKKSIAIDPYFTNMWNITDFLVYHNRKADAEPYLTQLPALINSKTDRKEYDKLFKQWQKLA